MITRKHSANQVIGFEPETAVAFLAATWQQSATWTIQSVTNRTQFLYSEAAPSHRMTQADIRAGYAKRTTGVQPLWRVVNDGFVHV
jgi:hypothetical protein